MMAATRSKSPRAGLWSVIGTSDDGGLERRQPAAVDVELDLDAERQGKVLGPRLGGIMSGGKAEADGIRCSGERVAHHLDRAHAVEGAAGCHGAEDDTGDPLELARLPQLGEQAIEAIGPLVHVLE